MNKEHQIRNKDKICNYIKCINLKCLKGVIKALKLILRIFTLLLYFYEILLGSFLFTSFNLFVCCSNNTNTENCNNAVSNISSLQRNNRSKRTCEDDTSTDTKERKSEADEYDKTGFNCSRFSNQEPIFNIEIKKNLSDCKTFLQLLDYLHFRVTNKYYCTFEKAKFLLFNRISNRYVLSKKSVNPETHISDLVEKISLDSDLNHFILGTYSESQSTKEVVFCGDAISANKINEILKIMMDESVDETESQLFNTMKILSYIIHMDKTYFINNELLDFITEFDGNNNYDIEIKFDRLSSHFFNIDDDDLQHLKFLIFSYNNNLVNLVKVFVRYLDFLQKYYEGVYKSISLIQFYAIKLI